MRTTCMHLCNGWIQAAEVLCVVWAPFTISFILIATSFTQVMGRGGYFFIFTCERANCFFYYPWTVDCIVRHENWCVLGVSFACWYWPLDAFLTCHILRSFHATTTTGMFRLLLIHGERALNVRSITREIIAAARRARKGKNSQRIILSL